VFRRLVGVVTASLVAVVGPAVGSMPTAYGAQTHGATQDEHLRPSHRYVALGDSYSSGEGAGAYLAGTDTATDTCHRSRLAYPRLLVDRQPRLGRLTFVACSGASTRDFYYQNRENPSEQRQLAALRHRTRAVSMTVGANDVGFSDVIAACLAIGPVPAVGCADNAPLNALVEARIAALAGQGTALDPHGHPITPIRKLLGDIHSRSPHATIFLGGYPQLFGHQQSSFTATPTGGYTCVVNSTVAARVDYADAQWLNRRTRQLDDVFHHAVRQARRAGISASYVSPSTFAGHGLCDVKTSWIQPLLFDGVTPQRQSFHPTARGQRLGYRRAFERAGL